MNINIRLETPQDYREIEILTREAFWGFTHPTCDEHYLIHKLRKVPAFVPELDFIAEVDGVLAGNIMYSKAKIISEDKVETEVLTFGPLSVLPKYWRCGLGTALMKHSIKEAIKLGYRAIVFYGHPDYYPRFGFRNAEAFGIKAPNGSNFDALMAMELYDGALNKITGTIIEDPVFYFEAEEADKYNELFPPKEPVYMIPIDILFDKIPYVAKQAFVERDIKTLAWLNRLSGREMLRWKGIDEEIIKTKK